MISSKNNKIGAPRFFILFLILLFECLPIFAFSEDIESLIQKSYVTEAYKESILKTLNNAIKDGIPEDLIEPRIREGVAKRADGQRILQVLQNEINMLKKARHLLLSVNGGKKLLKDEASWARTANLLLNGFSEDEIKTLVIASRKRWRDYRSATYLYASLIKWKLSREKSLRLTEAVLSSSIKGEDFSGIIDILITGRREHVSPEKLAERIIKTLPEVKSIEELNEKIFYMYQ